MLAYHFKVKSHKISDGNVRYVDSMTLLLKFRYKRLKIIVTLKYLAITVAIGLFINFIYESIK